MCEPRLVNVVEPGLSALALPKTAGLSSAALMEYSLSVTLTACLAARARPAEPAGTAGTSVTTPASAAARTRRRFTRTSSPAGTEPFAREGNRGRRTARVRRPTAPQTAAGGLMFMPCFWPIATRRSMSGGPVGAGGSSRLCAGSPASAKNFSMPPGV